MIPVRPHLRAALSHALQGAAIPAAIVAVFYAALAVRTVLVLVVSP